MAELRSSDVLAQSLWRKRECVFTTQPKQKCSYQHILDIEATTASQNITYYWIDDYQTFSLWINDQTVTFNESGVGKYTRGDDLTIDVNFSYDGHVVFFHLSASNSAGSPRKEWQVKWRVIIEYEVPVFNLKLHKVAAGCLETNSGNFAELQIGVSRTKNLLQFTKDFIYYPQGNNNWSPYNIQYSFKNWDDDTELGDYNQVKNAWSQVKKLIFYTMGD